MTDSPLPEDSSSEGDPPARNRDLVPGRLASAAVTDPIRVVSFWTAAVLPVVYLPLLAYGLDTPTRVLIFVALVAANVVALIVGRSYSAE